jgi:hypothetical protein
VRAIELPLSLVLIAPVAVDAAPGFLFVIDAALLVYAVYSHENVANDGSGLCIHGRIGGYISEDISCPLQAFPAPGRTKGNYGRYQAMQ